MTNALKYLHEEAKKGFAETYKQALEISFKNFLKVVYEHNDVNKNFYNINEARAEFEESSYYFLTLEEFEKYKLETLQSLRSDAQHELINLIDKINNIDDLREAKKIYDSIVKIVDSNQIEFHNDCELVLFN